jgi:hypothetical protein
MSDFEEAAKAYCKNRVEWLAIKRAMAATPCEWQDDADCRPCWIAEYEADLRPDEFCDACTGNNENRARRAVLGRRMPNLMKRMLRAYRALGEEVEDE